MENYAGLQSMTILLLGTALSYSATMSSYRDNKKGYKKIKSYYKILKRMQAAMPANYAPYAEMVAGEISRLDGEYGKALVHFQEAINVARAEQNPLF